MFCGSFHPEEDDDPGTSPCSTPRKYRGKDDKNPYSDRGLDRFEALMADLEEKRRRIYTQRGSDGISFVRFSYTSSNDCVPIVVKQKDRAEDGNGNGDGKGKHEYRHEHVGRSDGNEEMKDVFLVESPPRDKGSERVTKLKRCPCPSSSTPCGTAYPKAENWRRPSSYMPAAILLILLFLALSGRSLAILCISIAWYVVPALNGLELSRGRKSSTNQKEQGRRSGEKTTAPRDDRSSFLPDKCRIPAPDKPQHHNHGKNY